MHALFDRAAAAAFVAPVLFVTLLAGTLVSLAVTQEARRVGVVLDRVKAPSRFSPDGDGSRDEARIRLRSRRPAEDAAVRVVDHRGRLVATLAEGVRLAGGARTYEFVWDGATSAGGLAPAGRYRVEIVLRDQDRTIVPEKVVRLIRREGRRAGSRAMDARSRRAGDGRGRDTAQRDGQQGAGASASAS